MRSHRPILILIILFAFASSGLAQFNTYTILAEAREDVTKGNYFDAIQKLDECIQSRPGQYEAYFLRGVSKYFLNDNVGALQDLNVAVTVYDPYLSDAYHYRSFVKYRLGDYDGAIRDINQLITIQNSDPKLYMERAFSKLANQDYNGALKDCNKTLSMQWANDNLYLCKGMAENALSQYDSALADYNKALKINPKYPDVFIRIGMTNTAMGNYQQAIEQYNTALKLDSVNTLAFFSRAEAYVKLEDQQHAFEDFNTVIKLDPMNALAYFDRAIMEGQKNDYADALADFDKVLTLNPKNIQALFNRAKLKCAVNDYPGALADFNSTIDLFPYFIEAYYERARLKEAMHDNAGAQADYNTGKVMGDLNHYKDNSQRLNDSTTLTHLTALNSDFGGDTKKQIDTISIQLMPLFYISLNDNNAKTGCFPIVFKRSQKEYNNFCISNKELENQGNTADSALYLLNQGLKDTVMDIASTLQRAIKETNLQLFSDALKDCNNVIERDANSTITYFERAVSLCKEADMLSRFNGGEQYTTVNKTYKVATDTREEKYSSALVDLNKVIQQEPEFSLAYYNRAFVKYKLKDLAGAIDDYTKAIKLDPTFADAFYNRGLLSFLMNDKLSACQDYSKAGELGLTKAYQVIKLYCSQVLK